MILGKREEGEGANLFICEGPHSEELLPGVKMNFIQNLAFIDHPMETEVMEKVLFLSKSLGNNIEHHMSWKRLPAIAAMVRFLDNNDKIHGRM